MELIYNIMNPIMNMLCKNKPYNRLNLVNHVRDDPFSSYGRLPEKLIFVPLIRTRTCAYQSVRNISLPEIYCIY